MALSYPGSLGYQRRRRPENVWCLSSLMSHRIPPSLTDEDRYCTSYVIYRMSYDGRRRSFNL